MNIYENEQLKQELIDKEKQCDDKCKYYLNIEEDVFRFGSTNKIYQLIQDFNYVQGQRNLCRNLLREFFDVNIKGPDYELLSWCKKL